MICSKRFRLCKALNNGETSICSLSKDLLFITDLLSLVFSYLKIIEIICVIETNSFFDKF